MVNPLTFPPLSCMILWICARSVWSAPNASRIYRILAQKVNYASPQPSVADVVSISAFTVVLTVHPAITYHSLSTLLMLSAIASLSYILIYIQLPMKL